MPIYDYSCAACHKRFAVFFRSYSEVASVRCQHCGSDRVLRLAPRVAQVTSEDARLDRLSDPSSLGDELDDAMDGLADGGGLDDEPEPMPYSGGDGDADETT